MGEGSQPRLGPAMLFRLLEVGVVVLQAMPEAVELLAPPIVALEIMLLKVIALLQELTSCFILRGI